MISAFSGIKVVSSQVPFAFDETFNSTGVSRAGFGDCLIVVHIGVGLTLAAGVYYTLTFEESVDDSNYTTIADADIEGGLSATRLINATTEDEQVIVRGYKGSKPYVRVTGTLTGTDTTDTTMGVIVILFNPDKIPITPVTET